MADPSPSASSLLEDVIACERRGELLQAYDLATRALAEHPGDRRLKYRSVLLLARAGSAGARRRFADLGLAADDDEERELLDGSAA